MNSVEGESWTRWGHQIRSIEFDGAMKFVPLGRNSTVLEIGCGDGFQLGLLRDRFSRVFAIDPKHVPSRTSEFSFSVAEALPFGDCTFDLIISNCVVEHLTDRRGALDEMVRVLRSGGYMAHIVPARYWKAASLLLNPIGYRSESARNGGPGARPRSGTARHRRLARRAQKGRESSRCLAD